MENELYNNKYRIPSARAYWHDYNEGTYHVTICTDKREHFFGEIRGDKMILSRHGMQATKSLNELNAKYNDASVLSFVVMPNHIHLIIVVRNDNSKRIRKEAKHNIYFNEKMSIIANKRGRLSLIISKYKSSLTRYAQKNDIYFAWQSRFYDTIIKDYKELENVDNYIKNNIRNWRDDDYYSKISTHPPVETYQ